MTTRDKIKELMAAGIDSPSELADRTGVTRQRASELRRALGGKPFDSPIPLSATRERMQIALQESNHPEDVMNAIPISRTRIQGLADRLGLLREYWDAADRWAARRHEDYLFIEYQAIAAHVEEFNEDFGRAPTLAEMKDFYGYVATKIYGVLGPGGWNRLLTDMGLETHGPFRKAPPIDMGAAAARKMGKQVWDEEAMASRWEMGGVDAG